MGSVRKFLLNDQLPSIASYLDAGLPLHPIHKTSSDSYVCNIEYHQELN